ncbi:MAG: OmpA family protein [Bacteroidota bacterium]
MRSFVLLALAGLLFFSQQALGQSKVFSNISLSPSVGIMNYYGDLKNSESFTFDDTRLGFGLRLKKGFTSYFGASLDLNLGQLKGTKDSLRMDGVYFETDMAALTLNLELDVLELILDEPRLGLTGSVGYGLIFYDAQAFNLATEQEFVGNTTMADESSTTTLAVGLRFDYEINDKWSVGVGSVMNIIGSDNIDNWEGILNETNIEESTDDYYQYTSASVTYRFGPRKPRTPGGGERLLVDDLAEEARKDESATDPADEKVDISGVFEYRGLPVPNATMRLIDENDNIVQTTVTDGNGSFTFDKLDPDGNYLVEIDESQYPADDTRIYGTNKEGVKVVLMNERGSGRYAFRAMDEAALASLPPLPLKDDAKLIEPTKVDTTEVAQDEPQQVQPDKPKTTTPVTPKPDKPVETPKPDKPKVTKPDKIRGLTSNQKLVQAVLKPSDPKPNFGGANFDDETIYFRHNSFWVSNNQNKDKGSVIAKKLKANPNMRIAIFGFASKVGNPSYNALLSQRRANKLKSILVQQYGINSNRIEAIGKGEVPDPKMTDEEARKAVIVEIQ